MQLIDVGNQYLTIKRRKTMKRKPEKRHVLAEKIKQEYGTIIAFAWNVDCCDSLVSKVIHGWRDVEAARREKWAKALACTVAEIFPETVK